MEHKPPKLEEASAFFARGLEKCPKSIPLSICAAECKLQQGEIGAARCLLEKARGRIPGSDLLWLKAVEVEETGYLALKSKEDRESATLWGKAVESINTALKACPSSGLLWAKSVEFESAACKGAKIIDGLKKCENDTYMMLAAAQFLWRKNLVRAKEWVKRAVQLNPKFGDAWGLALILEIAHGGPIEQRDIILKCIRAEPTHGIRWQRVAKRVCNWRQKVAVKLRLYVEEWFPSEWKEHEEKLEDDILRLLRGEDVYGPVDLDEKDVKKDEVKEETMNL